jgi:DNA-binding NtrC family response regulator
MARLLVIEDEPLVRQTIRMILALDGHSIIEAENGALGLAQLAQNEVDLVLTDLVMPGMEGIETIKQIRLLHPHLKVVAISGTGAYNLYLNAASKLGANAVLQKPFLPAKLRETVARALSNIEDAQVEDRRQK